MNEMIEQYLPLVQQVVNRLAKGLPAHISKDDLFSMGTIGLLNSFERFEPEKGVKFETFATWRIRGAVLDGLREMDWVPRQVRQWAKQIEHAYGAVESEIKRSATDEEIAAYLEITPAELQKRLTQIAMGSFSSLEEPLHEFGEDQGLLDILADPKVQDPVAHITRDELKTILQAAIAKLPEKEKLVVALYYYEELSIKEISEILEVTAARVSQLHTKAISRLRGALSRRRQDFR